MISWLFWSACHRPPPPLVPGVCLTPKTVAGSTELGIRLQHDGCGELTLGDYEVLGEGAMTVDLFADEVRVLPRITADEDGVVFRGLHMRGPFTLAGDGPLVSWRQSFGSAGPSGVYELGPLTLDGGGVPVLAEEQAGTSWWAGLVGRQGGASVLLGAHTGRVTSLAVAFDGAEAHVRWAGRGEEIHLDAGDVLYLDPLFLGIGPEAQELWTLWADAVAVATSAGVPEVPGATWVAADPADLAANLAAAASLGIGEVQLRGWERARGDWLTDLPSAAGIADAGAKPVLWMAPFLVSPDSAVYADHPEWWVRDADGAELRVDGEAVVDVTHPEAAAWLEATIAGLVAAGWQGLVLDRLEVGAVEGQRTLEVTGVAAYAVGMDLVRRAAGPDTSLGAVDGLLLPSVGWVQTARGPAAGFGNGRWWWVDPGPVPVAGVERGQVVVAAVAGGVWTVEGPLAELSAEDLALALDADLVAGAGVPATPEDPLSAAWGWGDPDGPVPSRWSFDDGRTALLNLSDAPIEVDGPGGEELLTGETAEAGSRELAAGQGEIWR